MITISSFYNCFFNLETGKIEITGEDACYSLQKENNYFTVYRKDGEWIVEEISADEIFLAEAESDCFTQK